MKSKRLLLPFHHGMNMGAIEQGVRLAKGSDATLVLLALLPVPDGRGTKAPRLDLVQQAKDFFGGATYKASMYGVPVERYEVYTHHVKQAIETVGAEMKCDGIVLFLEGNDGVLLSAGEIHHLFKAGGFKLYVLHLSMPVSKTVFRVLRERLPWGRSTNAETGEEAALCSPLLEPEVMPVEV